MALSHHTAVRKDLAQDSARVTAQKAHKPAVRNEVALNHHTAVRKDLAQDSARVTAQKAHKPAVRNEVALNHHTAVRKDLAQDSARVTAQKAHKPAVRNGVVLGTTLVNPVLARKVHRFGANNLMASRAVARAAKETNPAIAPKARKPVARARPTAAPKVDLSHIAVTGVPAAKPVQTE